MDSFAVEALANQAAQSKAARYGFFLDHNNKAHPIPDENFDDQPDLSLDEIALELRIKTY
jgi:hypothetical protein